MSLVEEDDEFPLSRSFVRENGLEEEERSLGKGSFFRDSGGELPHSPQPEKRTKSIFDDISPGVDMNERIGGGYRSAGFDFESDEANESEGATTTATTTTSTTMTAEGKPISSTEEEEHNRERDETAASLLSRMEETREERRRRGEDDDLSSCDSDDDQGTLEDHAEVVMMILQPVAITMVLVIWIVKVMNSSAVAGMDREYVRWYMVYHESSDDTNTTKFLGAALNALLFVVMVLVVTILFVLLYKYRCLKVIYTWLIGSTGLLLAVFGSTLFYLMLEGYNLPLDWISYSFLVWNFAVGGLVSIFWYGPMKVQQGYLVIISALLAVFFTKLPEWTTWAILTGVAIYDLFAVLCPRGPLKVLVETAQERREPIPALLYSSAAFMFVVGLASEEDLLDGVPGTSASTTTSSSPSISRATLNSSEPTPDEEDREDREGEEEEGVARQAESPEESSPPTSLSSLPQLQRESPEECQRPRKSVKLGLGDFVFYSVLVGRAALYDMITAFTCFIGIITGLFLTLLLLAVFRKALPALPISIALGLIFYLLTKTFLLPFIFATGTMSVFA